MEMITEMPVTALTELLMVLEQATLMAKQLPNTTDPPQLLQIYSTLHSAQHHLSSFLTHHLPGPPPSQPASSPPLLAVAENSVTSAVCGDENDTEPMQIGHEDEAEEMNSRTKIDRVEERMRDIFIQNKKPKRPLSPSKAAAAEQRRAYGNNFFSDSLAAEFDPQATRLRSLDLIYQFHG